MNFAMQLTGKVKTRPMIACPECGREFQRNRKADLQRHMRIHTNEKPFVCPYPDCGKAFRQSSALKNHSNYHQRDTSFTCDQCNMNFFDKPTFNRHVREKHELEYVFACSIVGCGKHFKRKPVFKQHMQDKHSIVYNDQELLAHRVSAEPYLRAAHGSKAAYHSNLSPLPRLADALQSVHIHSAQPPAVQINSGVYYSSNPAVYGSNNADAVLLNDPYSTAKSVHATYATPTSHYTQTFGDYATPYDSMPTNFWMPSGGPNDTYFDGQIFGNMQPAGIPSAAPTISLTPAPSPPHGSPNPSFMFSSSSSSGNTNGGSMGSYSPHSSYSRASSASPISPVASPATQSQQPQYTLRPYIAPPYY
ncbi:uncharacterized protein FOMMEDRAFT_21907 [Fomitiporia mediterranea MF3/22]|uniref:uncharacterized protein n=1 Tax=Fomitiporia mediterranea (strain MF3/22) TaxID=694068 RepID=UPI0004408EE4|nr:uncharacterized protein FOMMEDRAFT_21907 [Fomitiporia mediterranea MF3/22]EJD01527.1 hypothetical protein FOMMEDRAFT_21907 [Fomitiporia mediterranea MF3/22]